MYVVPDQVKMYLRQLQRLKARLVELEARHKGNELDFTYWGGFDMGYVKGQINILEDIFHDELEG